jgi:hypothetical protein
MRPLPYPLRFARKIKRLLALRSGDYSATWVQIPSGTPNYPNSWEPHSERFRFSARFRLVLSPTYTQKTGRQDFSTAVTSPFAGYSKAASATFSCLIVLTV